jgi:phage terminase large subunit
MDVNIDVSKRFSTFLTDWNYEQYLLFGGYGSGKSYHVALKIILKLLEERRTCLVVRQVYGTIKESCFALFKEILEKMNMLSDESLPNQHLPKNGKAVAVMSPMEVRFSNGSRIIFRGMDNVEKIKSIHGVSIVWMEECSEIRYDAYTELLFMFSLFVLPKK